MKNRTTARAAATRPESARQKLPAAPHPDRSEPANPIWQQLATRPRIQAKLTVGAPDDPFEREADQVADRVMRMPEPAVQRKCAHCEEEEKEGRVQAKEEPGAIPSLSPDAESRIQGLRGGGSPLPESDRSYFEPRFGRDFGGVRVHTGPEAADAARSIQARAFTLGQDIVFGAGEYAPRAPEGRRLLAHELTHVVQQGSAQAGPVARAASRRIQRQTLKLRNGHEVGVASPGATANIKSEAEQALKRLLDLWAIETTAYENAIKSWAGYGPDDVIAAADLTPLTDAITKSEQPTLAASVANNFLALNPKITNNVGVGQANGPDLTTVQNSLIAHGFLKAAIASGTMDSATEGAIKNLKKAIASGTFGLDPMRANEKLDGRDRLAGQTFRVIGGPITVLLPPEPKTATEPAKPARSVTKNKTFTVFVSGKVPTDKNKVHIFFTPLADEEKFVNEQGLRAEHESSDWILIAVPGLEEAIQPNFVTISTAEIQSCLSTVKRPATIDAIRLSAHSRGHRGLEHTMGFGGSPLIDLGLVERVTVFDASYKDLGATLTAHTKDLTRMQDPANRATLAAGTVNLYDVTVANISGFKGKSFDVSGIRGLAYVRFMEEGLKLGKIDKIDIATLKNDPKKDVQGATKRLLAAIPPRGGFSTRTPTPSGKQDLASFLSSNKADLTLVDDPKDGLSRLVANELDLGYKFDLNLKDPNRTLSAHHWLAAELGHESFD